MKKDKIDLSNLKGAGVYSVLTSEKLEPIENKLFYCAMYININSWNDRIKKICEKRIELEPVWLLVDVNKELIKILVTNLQEFEEIVAEIEKILKDKNNWIEAKKEEPKDLDKIICLYHPNFRDKIIICDEYRPKEKKFYYEDGEHYNNISLNYPNLKWTYIENLIPEKF